MPSSRRPVHSHRHGLGKIILALDADRIRSSVSVGIEHPSNAGGTGMDGHPPRQRARSVTGNIGGVASQTDPIARLDVIAVRRQQELDKCALCRRLNTQRAGGSAVAQDSPDGVPSRQGTRPSVLGNVLARPNEQGIRLGTGHVVGKPSRIGHRRHAIVDTHDGVLDGITARDPDPPHVALAPVDGRHDRTEGKLWKDRREQRVAQTDEVLASDLDGVLGLGRIVPPMNNSDARARKRVVLTGRGFNDHAVSPAVAVAVVQGGGGVHVLAEHSEGDDAGLCLVACDDLVGAGHELTASLERVRVDGDARVCAREYEARRIGGGDRITEVDARTVGHHERIGRRDRSARFDLGLGAVLGADARVIRGEDLPDLVFLDRTGGARGIEVHINRRDEVHGGIDLDAGAIRVPLGVEHVELVRLAFHQAEFVEIDLAVQ